VRLDLADAPADIPKGKFRRVKNLRLSGWQPLIEPNVSVWLIIRVVAVPSEYVKLEFVSQQLDQIGNSGYRPASFASGQVPVSEN